MLTHRCIVAGVDVSEFVISARVQQTTDPNDEDKIDLILANTRNRFTGLFKTQDRMEMVVYNEMKSCEGSKTLTIQLFYGEVVKTSYDVPLTVQIEGACMLGTLTDNLKEQKIYPKGTTPSTIVKDLIATHGGLGTPIVDITLDRPIDQEMTFGIDQDYQTALTKLCKLTGSYYYFDESGQFWFVDPKNRKGYTDVTGYLLNPNQTFDVIGHSNVVKVIGGSMFPPEQDGSEIPTHRQIQKVSRNESSVSKHGELVAVPIIIPYADETLTKAVSVNIKEFFKTVEDLAKPILVGRAPLIDSFVSYRLPAIAYSDSCDKGSYATTGSAVVRGLVKVRTVEYSIRGLVCQLQLSTEVPAAGLGYMDSGEVDPASLSELTDDQVADLVAGGET